MKGFVVSLWVESLKARRSKVFTGTMLFFIFIGLLMGLFMYVARNPEIAGRSAVMSTKVSMIGSGDWPSFFNLLVQMILTVGMLGFGLVAGWLFGREYADKVIKDIVCLPVSRTSIVFSKLAILFIWSILLAILLFFTGMITGFLTNMPGWSTAEFLTGLSMYMQCAFLNVLICTPVAFIASLGRGYLLSIAYIILSLIITQLLFVGMPEITIYFPWALPALHSGIAGEAAPLPNGFSYLIYILTILAGAIITAAWWRFADLKA